MHRQYSWSAGNGFDPRKWSKLAAIAAVPAAAAVLAVGYGAVTQSAAATPTAAQITQIRAGSSVRELSIQIAGRTLVVGASKASGTAAGSAGGTTGVDPSAAASGMGELLPILTGSAHTQSAGPGTSDNQPQRCATPTLPSLPQIGQALDAGLACASADTSITQNGLVSATGSGSVASVQLSLAGILNLLGPVTGLARSGLPTTGLPGIGLPATGGSQPGGGIPSIPLPSAALPAATRQRLAGLPGDGSNGGSLPGIGTAGGGTAGTLPSLPLTGAPLASILGTLLHIPVSSEILSIQSGPATSTVESVGGNGSMKSTALANAVRLDLLPGAGQNGLPLLSVSLGVAGATASYDAVNGTFSSSDSPAIATVTVSTPASGAKTEQVASGQSITVLPGTPLQSTVTVASGSHSASGSGALASSSGLSVDLAEGAGAPASDPYGGGLRLSLATADATLAGAAAPSSSTLAKTVSASTPPAAVGATAAPITGATSVHTGEPWSGSMPYLVGMVLAGLVLLEWRRISRLAAVLCRRLPPPAGGRATGTGRWAGSGSR